jgi:hypothetical protein
MKEIVQERGVFFVTEKQPSTSPRFTTNSPSTHHKNTTFLHPLFPDPPQKTPAKTTKPRLSPGLHFFLKR